MEKSEVLGVGCGGCGNNLVNQFLSSDKRYTGIFMNTNLREMQNLENFDRDRRCFYIPNADGTGKDRDLCEKYIKEEAPKFAEMIRKFTNQETIYFFASANGGTGSKSIILLAKVTKKLCPNKFINVVLTMPSISESDIDFKNAKATWNELLTIQKQGVINNIQIIDNNKPFSEKEINQKAIKDIDTTIGLGKGNLDTSDLKRFHHSNGYKVVLRLDNQYESTSQAIDKAIENSVFFIPENLESDILLADINTNDFDISVIKDKFKGYEFSKIREKESGESVILIGGCDIPNEAIELIEEASKEIKKRKANRVRNSADDLFVKDDSNKSQNKKANKKQEVTDDEFDEMFKDDDFWDLL
jgi:cell division GTPase FtsZ